MFYKNYLILAFFLFTSNCTTSNLTNKNSITVFDNIFINKGFALVYTDELYLDKVISTKVEERSLIILQRNLKKDTQVKITNLINNKSVLAIVGKKSNYPWFNNSVISARIADELKLNLDEPYIEITAISESSLFVAKKAKMYDEEKKVAIKVPVNNISIDNLKVKKITKQKKKIRKFSYNIKIADFYFNKTAISMAKRIKADTSIKKTNIRKISDKKYRVYLGPFNNINSLQKSYNDIKILDFENIEIIRND